MDSGLARFARPGLTTEIKFREGAGVRTISIQIHVSNSRRAGGQSDLSAEAQGGSVPTASGID
jgi:hypothetical protein